MTSIRPARRAGALSRTTGDRGSLPMALLLTLVGISLSALLVPVVVGQITVTRAGAERNRALHAAQAGIDAALGQIRAASDGEGNGVVEKLPRCELNGELLPDSAQDVPRPRYRVQIAYWDADGPDGPDGPGGADGVRLACPPTEVPASATLVATGIETPGVAFDTGTAGTRTLEATYSFQTTNANIAGGSIQVAQPTVSPLCMDAGPNDPPKPNDPLLVKPCKPGVSEQQFAYTEDLNLKLVGSESSSAPMGMCLDTVSSQATNAPVVFRPCEDRRTPKQQWSLNNNSNFQGTTNGVGLNNFCLNVKTAGLAGSPVVLGGCSATANKNVFRPQTGVGAGMAGPAIGQLVNFKQFSRCLDVTDHVVTRAYMIVWFCKQAPDGNVSWNQKWSIPAVTAPAWKTSGRIRTVTGGKGYCLRSPLSTAANQYVTVAECAATGTLASNLQWTLYGDTGDYATSYRIMDGKGYCLVPTDLEVLKPDTHSDGTSKTKVAVCDDSELQKWNAPANLKKPLPLTDINER